MSNEKNEQGALAAGFCVVVEDPPTDEAGQTVRQGLFNYNKSKTRSDFARVQVIARDGAGEVCGGAIGYVAWGELYVDILWVDERARGQGIGSRLMTLIEQEAARHKCHRVHLGTMSHQAPGFYPKVGYIQFAFFPGKNGWPDRYHFYKDIPAEVSTLSALSALSTTEQENHA